jgi:hypothetical protein
VRKRQRKNWPDSARSSARWRPPITTDTTPGASGLTSVTRSRCRSACRTGVMNRNQAIAEPTPRYRADQATRAAVFVMNSAPSANWWLNASATAR